MRAKFEAWARPRWAHPEDFDQRIGALPGTYNNYEVQAAWNAWRAAVEACASLVEAGKVMPTANEGTVVVDWDSSEEAASALRDAL